MTPNRGGFAAAVLPGERRAGYGAAPPASRVATAIAGRRACGPALDPGGLCGPSREAAGGRSKAPCPPTARRSRPDPYKQSLYGYRGLPSNQTCKYVRKAVLASSPQLKGIAHRCDL